MNGCCCAEASHIAGDDGHNRNPFPTATTHCCKGRVHGWMPHTGRATRKLGDVRGVIGSGYFAWTACSSEWEMEPAADTGFLFWTACSEGLLVLDGFCRVVTYSERLVQSGKWIIGTSCRNWLLVLNSLLRAMVTCFEWLSVLQGLLNVVATCAPRVCRVVTCSEQLVRSGNQHLAFLFWTVCFQQQMGHSTCCLEWGFVTVLDYLLT